LVTQASNQSSLIGPSSTIGATMLSGKLMPANGARKTLSKTSRSSTTAKATVDRRDNRITQIMGKRSDPCWMKSGGQVRGATRRLPPD
jgi:hypothetical protein